MIANKWCISTGIGASQSHLPAFDKALIDAGIGNYNLVRLSSILPARASESRLEILYRNLPEGSLLPTAYSTISSNTQGEQIVSAIGVGLPVDKDCVGVIMEYSEKGIGTQDALDRLDSMIKEAFETRQWELDKIVHAAVEAIVERAGMEYATFACIVEW